MTLYKFKNGSSVALELIFKVGKIEEYPEFSIGQAYYYFKSLCFCVWPIAGEPVRIQLTDYANSKEELDKLMPEAEKQYNDFLQNWARCNPIQVMISDIELENFKRGQIQKG